MWSYIPKLHVVLTNSLTVLIYIAVSFFIYTYHFYVGILLLP